MRTFLPRVAGNEDLRARLGAELAKGTHPHAYIIEGPRGSGKRTLAVEMAMATTCARRAEGETVPCGECPACRKIRAGLSPDVIRVKREADKATMGVDTVRAVRGTLATVPNDLDLKIYIIEDAHTMTAQAQNAFLLSLEEPPPFVFFLLLTEDAGALLETIRSRAPVLRMRPVAEREIADYIRNRAEDPAARAKAARLAETDPAAFAVLLKLAHGCIGAALELLDEDRRAPLTQARETALTLCRLLAARAAPAEWLAPLSALGAKRESVAAGLSLFGTALRDLLLLDKEEEAPLLFFTEREEAQTLAARLAATRIIAANAAIDETLTSLLANANVRIAVADLCGRLCR